MPSKHKSTSKKLAMPRESSDSEHDEFADERRQRGMYDDSDSEAGSDARDSENEDEEDEESGSEAESSAMARRRWQGFEPDELDGQEEEFTDASDSGDGSEDEEDSEGEAPRRGKSDQERLASLRKSKCCVAGVRCSSNAIILDLEQVPLSELLKAQRKLVAKQHGSDSESDSAPTASSTNSNSKTRLETIKRQLLLLQQKKGKALAVPVPRAPEPEYSDEEGKGDPRDGGEGPRNNLWDVRNARKEDRAREREWEEKRAEEREKRKRDGKHA